MILLSFFPLYIANCKGEYPSQVNLFISTFFYKYSLTNYVYPQYIAKWNAFQPPNPKSFIIEAFFSTIKLYSYSFENKLALGFKI